MRQDISVPVKYKNEMEIKQDLDLDAIRGKTVSEIETWIRNNQAKIPRILAALIMRQFK